MLIAHVLLILELMMTLAISFLELFASTQHPMTIRTIMIHILAVVDDKRNPAEETGKKVIFDNRKVIFSKKDSL